MKRAMARVLPLPLLLLPPLVLAAGGCLTGDHCDPGMRYENHSCVVQPDAAPPPAPAPPPPADDGGSLDDGAGGDGGAGMCPMYAGFGDPCTNVSQCRCGLDYCDTYMNTNRCTRIGCKQNPSLCPPGWTCMDLSVFLPTLPSLCTKP